MHVLVVTCFLAIFNPSFLPTFLLDRISHPASRLRYAGDREYVLVVNACRERDLLRVLSRLPDLVASAGVGVILAADVHILIQQTKTEQKLVSKKLKI